MNSNVSSQGVRLRFFEGDLQQLRCFYYAATYGSFTRAAGELATGQPSVSNHIKQLERLLGAQLFYRRRQGVELTPAGKILFELASPLVEGIDRLSQDLGERLSSFNVTEVRLAGGQEILLRLLGPIVETFRQENPHVRLIVYARVHTEAQAMVAGGEVDFGIVAQTGLPPDLHFLEVLSDELVLIASLDHELARREQITLEEAARYPMLMPDLRSSTRRIIEEAFHQRGLKVDIAMELGRWGTIREFVALNQGIALVPGFSVPRDDSRLVVKHLCETLPRLSYGIVTRRGAYLSPPARQLIQAIRSRFAYPTAGTGKSRPAQGLGD